MDTIFGVDPGNNGAIIQLNRRGGDWHLDRCFRLEHGEDAIARFVHDEVICEPLTPVYIERVTGFGGGIGLKLRENFGFLKGCFKMRGLSVTEVLPQRWMAQMGVQGKSQTAEKRQSMRALAAELQDDVQATNWNSAAILIAFYGTKQTEVYENNEVAR